MRQKNINRKLRNVNLTKLRGLIRSEKSRGNLKFAKQIYLTYKNNGGKSKFENM